LFVVECGVEPKPQEALSMSKPGKDSPELTDEELAFEMIELASDDVESLARAFNMINDLCKELSEEIARKSVTPPDSDLN